MIATTGGVDLTFFPRAWLETGITSGVWDAAHIAVAFYKFDIENDN